MAGRSRDADGYREVFREVGWVEGRNLSLDFRWADGNADKAAMHARELVASGVDVLVVRATPAVNAAVAATRTRRVPIVTWSADPLGVGIVGSLARPGGNLTGVSTNSIALSAKRLELLRACLAPRVSDSSHRRPILKARGSSTRNGSPG